MTLPGSQTDAGHRAAPLTVPLSLADCAYWRTATESERRSTVRRLHAVAVGDVGSPGGRGPALGDKGAFHLFDTYCANDFARGFRLYRLYGRAAALAGR